MKYSLHNPFMPSSRPMERAVHDPGSLLALFGGSASAGGAVSTISTVASVAGAVLPVVGAIQQNRAAREQEAEFERQSREERLFASIQAEKDRRAARQRQSAERAAFIEGGAFSGTAMGVLEQNAVAQELDALTVEFQGEQQARGSEFRARQAGRSASPLNVFSAAIEGFNQFDPLNISN